MKRMPKWPAVLIAALLLTPLAFAGAQTSYFVTTLGKDTLSFEVYRHTADTVVGDWVTLYGGIMYHHYRIVLRADGSVATYSLALHRVSGAREGGVGLTFSRDSVVVTTDDTTHVTHALPGGTMPVFARTVAPLELMTRQLRAASLDSGVAWVVNAFGPYHPNHMPVVFYGPDSARLGGIFVQVDRSGTILGLSARGTTTRTETRRVAPFQLSTVLQGFPDVPATTDIVGVPALSPRDTARGTVEGTEIVIDYGRPAVRGRSVFSHGVLGDTIWRTGANAATQLTTSGELHVGGHLLPAGTYSVWTHVRADNSSYELILNRQHGQWGTEYHAEQDVLRAPLEVVTGNEAAERFTISVVPNGKGARLIMRWATTSLAANLGP